MMYSFESLQNALYLALPMVYDGDSTDMEFYLEEGGFVDVTPENIHDAIKYCTSRFEKDLWQDNVGKQMLGDVFGDNPIALE